MKAIVQTVYGPPEALEYKEVEKPVPAEGEVLIKVHAASINFGDAALVQGKPFLIRLMGYGVTKPKHALPAGSIAPPGRGSARRSRRWAAGSRGGGWATRCLAT